MSEETGLILITLRMIKMMMKHDFVNKIEKMRNVEKQRITKILSVNSAV